MKKIIWLFGQSATDKKTLINKLLSGDVKTLEDLNFQGKKIVACKNTIIDDKQVLPTKPDNFTYDDKTLEKDNEYFNQEKAKNRRSCIMTDVLSFLNSNYERNKVILEEFQKYNYQYVDTAAGNKRDLILEELLRKITEKNS